MGTNTSHVLLFTGHQVDAPGRKTPRFPADKEPLARAAIRAAIEQELAQHAPAVGIAGGASGGDILFHEICAERHVPTRLYLALPPDAYVHESVEPGGPDWVRRFHEIESLPSAEVLPSDPGQPESSEQGHDESIWQRTNLWMLEEALKAGAKNVTLIALWNGQKGDGPGGTADMIATARDRGADVRVLDSNKIFGLPPSEA